MTYQEILQKPYQGILFLYQDCFYDVSGQVRDDQSL